MEPQALPKGVNPDSVVLVDGVYYEVCVGAGCKKNTKVRFDCPVGERRYWVDGSGQLCADCYRKTYPRV